MYSLRKRMTAGLAGALALLLLLAGLALASRLAREATSEFDTALVARARTFVALTEEEEGRIELDYPPKAMPEFEREERPDHFQFWLEDGRVLLRSRGLAGDLPRAADASSEPVVWDAPLPGGRPGRLVEIAFRAARAGRTGDAEDPPEAAARGEGAAPPAAPGVVLVVGRGREGLDALLGRIRWTVLGTAGLAAAAAALLVWWGLRRGLRPVAELASQVQGLSADRLRSRVALPRMPREVAPFVEEVNALLARLQDSFERERQFTGNVAHELRTPIAELRTLASVGAKWPGDEAAVVGYFRDVGDVAGRMERLIADLLLLARCQAGVETFAGAPTDVSGLIASAWAPLAPRAAAAGLRLRTELPADLVVRTDPDKLGIILGNLLRNAVAYARPGGEIRCVAARAPEGFRVEIANPADPLSPEDLRHLAEPFWRKDGARTSDEHAGLGLAIVRALAGLLGLRVTFAQDPEGVFRVRLEGRGEGGAEGALAAP